MIRQPIEQIKISRQRKEFARRLALRVIQSNDLCRLQCPQRIFNKPSTSLALSTTLSHYHAVERSRLVTIGKTPPFADGQIAAIARVNDLILVINNTLDYKKF